MSKRNLTVRGFVDGVEQPLHDELPGPRLNHLPCQGSRLFRPGWALILSTLPLHPGPALRLSVRDTGSGMDAATLARAFEPFFTTKAPGRGTGLGLAIVHNIVEAHRGRVFIESAIGQGTLVQVLLPVLESPAD